MKPPKKKKITKVPAPKGLELKLESKSSLRAKAIKASFQNTMETPFSSGKDPKDIVRKIKVKNASQVGKFNKKK